MTSYESFEVISHFINIGIGDAAVHVLVKKLATKKVEAVSMVLIDGGLKTAQATLENAIKQIKSQYKLSTFQSIVITHWDEDHYGAVTEMLYNDFVHTGKGKSSYIKSGSKIYFPLRAWNKIQSGGKFKLEEKDDKLMLRINCGPSAGNAATYFDLCEAIVSTYCIGHDLFTGGNINGTNKLLENPLPHLADAYLLSVNLINKRRPVFLCVGADEYFISRPLVKPNPNFMRVPTQNKSKSMNASSIMACVIWPSTKTLRISLYTGGDAGEDQEEFLVEWMSDPLHPNAQLDAIKAGHHGSHFSTPEGLLNFKTGIWVISAGDEYGHPSFAVLFFLMAIVRSRLPQKWPLILATCPPYWLFSPLNELSRADFNLNMVLNFGEGSSKLERFLVAFTKNTEIMTEWFGEAAAHLIFTYESKYSAVQLAALRKKFRKSIMAIAKPPKFDPRRTEESAYLDAMEIARRVMKDAWAQFGDPKFGMFGHSRSEPIVIRADSRNTYYGTKRQTSGSQLQQHRNEHKTVYVFVSGEPAGTRRARGIDEGFEPFKKWHGERTAERQKRDLKARTRKAKDSINMGLRRGEEGEDVKNLLTGLIQALPSQFSIQQPRDTGSELYDWTFRLFVNDLIVQGNIPSTMKRFPLERDSSPCLQWFRHCLGDSTSLKFDGTKGQGDSIDLQEIRIEFSPKPGKKPLSVFTTACGARELQFGSHVNDQQQNHLGFDERIEGMLFALEPSDTKDGCSFEEFAAFIHFETSPWVTGLLGKLPLFPITAAGACSGLWFVPCYNSRTIVRLAMEPDTNSPEFLQLEGTLRSLFSFDSLTNVVIWGICTHDTVSSKSSLATSALSLEADMTWKSGGPPGFEGKVGIVFTDNGFTVTMNFSKSSNIIKTILDWVRAKLTTAEEDEINSTLVASEDSINELQRLMRIFTRGPDVEGSSVQNVDLDVRSVSLEFLDWKKPVAFDCNIEVPMPCGDKQTSLLVSFYWDRGTYALSAELWNEITYGDIPKQLHPYKNDMKHLMPRVLDRVEKMSIKELLRQPKLKFPGGVPDTISEARVSFTYGQDNYTTIGLEATLESLPNDPENESDIPAIWPQELYLALTLTFHKGGKLDFSMRLRGGIVLDVSPRYLTEEMDFQIQIRTMIEYVNDSSGSFWDLTAEVNNIKVANLYELFAGDGSGHAIMEVMSKISIPNAYINYKYHSKNGNSLDIGGTLRLGTPDCSVDLDLSYSHKSKVGWSFNAELKASPDAKHKDLNIAKLLTGLVDNTELLPEMVQNLVIPISKIKIILACKSTTDKDESDKPRRKHVIFCLSFEIEGSFNISFTQIRAYDGSTTSGDDLPPPAKTPGRLLRFTLSNLPKPQGIPGIGTMPQPFDQLGVVWSSRDISAEEISILNDEVFHAHLKLLVKETKDTSKGALQPLPLAKPQLPIFLAGFHFQIATLEQGGSNLIVDHVGRQYKKQPEKHGTKSSSRGVILSVNDKSTGQVSLDDENGPPETSVAPMVKTFGPVSISSIGVSVDGEGKVKLVLDAEVRIGPLSFALLGLTILVDTSSFKSPEDLKKFKVDVNVAGIAVEFEKPPTRLAGLFLKFENQEARGYEGAIAVAIGAWSAIAGGMYEELKPSFSTKSFFVFGMLQGPIAEFGCAEINGITGGFGYNSHLAIPSNAKDVPDFPFVALNTRREEAPKRISDQLSLFTGRKTGRTGVVSIAKDSIWFAAGLGLKAFQTVEAQAVIALNISAQPKFSMIVQATAVFPKNLKPDKNAKDPLAGAFLVLDLGLVANIDPNHGVILAAGELTPRSFILSPLCKLTGGFALAYFLPGSANEGDFVFTVGGYHPRYKPPQHYPPAPKRVEISWQYDSQLSIKGEAYFAITPQAAMGGGRLDMVLDKGWARASFSAFAHFFMNFHPFYFTTVLSITLSASINTNWGPFPIRFGPEEFTAELKLRGPPIAGRASLKIKTFTIIVYFGPEVDRPAALGLGEFLRMVKNVPSEWSDEQAGKVPNHLFSITRGAVASNKPGDAPDAAQPLEIRGSELQFEVQTRVPVLSAKIGENPAGPVKLKRDGREEYPEIHISPMQQRLYRSHLIVYMVRRDKHGQEKLETSTRLEATMLLKKVAPALWGKYNESAADVASAPMIEHAMGYSVKVVAKEPSPDGIPAFSIIKFNSLDVGKDGEKDILPNIRAVENTRIHERFNLVRTGDSTIKMRKSCESARDNALMAWDRFKTKYSNGGLGLKDVVPPIFSKDIVSL